MYDIVKIQRWDGSDTRQGEFRWNGHHGEFCLTDINGVVIYGTLVEWFIAEIIEYKD